MMLAEILAVLVLELKSVVPALLVNAVQWWMAAGAPGVHVLHLNVMYPELKHERVQIQPQAAVV